MIPLLSEQAMPKRSGRLGVFTGSRFGPFVFFPAVQVPPRFFGGMSFRLKLLPPRCRFESKAAALGRQGIDSGKGSQEEGSLRFSHLKGFRIWSRMTQAK
jgi:hypothetical protein